MISPPTYLSVHPLLPFNKHSAQRLDVFWTSFRHILLPENITSNIKLIACPPSVQKHKLRRDRVCWYLLSVPTCKLLQIEGFGGTVAVTSQYTRIHTLNPGRLYPELQLSDMQTLKHKLFSPLAKSYPCLESSRNSSKQDRVRSSLIPSVDKWLWESECDLTHSSKGPDSQASPAAVCPHKSQVLPWCDALHTHTHTHTLTRVIIVNEN